MGKKYEYIHQVDIDKEYDGKVERETLYLVPENDNLRTFIEHRDKIEEINPSLGTRSWNTVKDVFYSKLSDGQIRELMEEKGLAKLLEN